MYIDSINVLHGTGSVHVHACATSRIAIDAGAYIAAWRYGLIGHMTIIMLSIMLVAAVADCHCNCGELLSTVSLHPEYQSNSALIHVTSCTLPNLPVSNPHHRPEP
jgi:hypothetical protein